jgi:signal transduction histidine kinase
MDHAAAPHLVAAGMHLLPALVWGIIAWDTWRYLLGRRPRDPMNWVVPALATCTMLHYAVHTLLALTPTELGGLAPGLKPMLERLITVSVVMSLPPFRHMAHLIAVNDERIPPTWLVVNYGSALAILVAFWLVGTAPPPWRPEPIAFAYAFVMSVLSILELSRLARRGGWRAGRLIELRSADVVVLVCAMAAFLALILVVFLTGRTVTLEATMPGLALHTAMGLALAVPFAVRMMGEVVRAFLMTVAMAGAAGGIYLGTRTLAATIASPELARLVHFGGILLLLLALVPGRAVMHAAIDRLVFRRSWLRRVDLQASLHGLSPELGTLECCRRALAELGRIMQISGAAVLTHDGGQAIHGSLELGRLAAIWPRGEAAAALPRHALFGMALRDFPSSLREALTESRIVWVLPIVSPRQHWGHLFATQTLLAAPLSHEDVDAVEAFADQLARVLDGAALLTRAVAVERSLAHSEKLAVIGELTARIAHEIRNPVTAARSLAQQLVDEPASPYRTEHGVILEELERIERHVAELLRFARHEEYQFDAVDLGELVAVTMRRLRPRLEAAGVGVELDVPRGVVAHADREKMRQVLVNLIENSIDALRDVAGTRRLSIGLSGANGVVRVRVGDTGPGVPAAALPQLFQPFFSTKATGTGLGLAIVRRTVEAHRGRIAASCPDGSGMLFEIELPAAAV